MLHESALSRRFDDALSHGILSPGYRGRGPMENLQETPARTPWHLWAIGAIGLLWLVLALV